MGNRLWGTIAVLHVLPHQTRAQPEGNRDRYKDDVFLISSLSILRTRQSGRREVLQQLRLAGAFAALWQLRSDQRTNRQPLLQMRGPALADASVAAEFGASRRRYNRHPIIDRQDDCRSPHAGVEPGISRRRYNGLHGIG
ncbi:MAG: hypothetical protein WKH97_10020 [Casimicrobiaceae bacterium]